MTGVQTCALPISYKWAGRIIVLDNGSIIADDKPVKIFTSDEILKRANLGKPMFLQVYEIIMKKYGKNLNTYGNAPKSINEFARWFNGLTI